MEGLSLIGALGMGGVGLGVGAIGTLVGLGGGFLFVPILLLVYHTSPAQAVGTSLLAIFFNALSGTIAYSQQRRIDYKTGVKFGVATLPGVAIGEYLIDYLASPVFYIVFGVLLIGMAFFQILWPRTTPEESPGLSCAHLLPPSYVVRTIVDSHGRVFRYTFQERVGLVVSFFAGIIAGLLGLGGGVIHIPVMVYMFTFPPHVAMATSHFILSITSLAGTGLHLKSGNVLYIHGLLLGAGALLGAQAGAALSQRLGSRWLIYILSVAVILVGIRLLFGVGE